MWAARHSGRNRAPSRCSSCNRAASRRARGSDSGAARSMPSKLPPASTREIRSSCRTCPRGTRSIASAFNRSQRMEFSGPPPVVKLRNLTKVFVTDEVETHALSEVTLEIVRGEYVSISGPSVCGKSTLLSIIGLLDSPTRGTYDLNGRPVSDLSASERAKIRNREIGFIFQSFNLIGDLSVFENVELPLTYRGM